MNRRQFLHLGANALGATAIGMQAFDAAARSPESDYPSRHPIRWIVPYPPGGGSDAKARAVAASMRYRLNQELVIENRPGAATNIAAEFVARSAPDGYTIMTADNAILFFNEHLFSDLRYSPEKDFSYLGTLGRFPLALVLSHHFPAKTYEGFVAHVKANPDKVTYASAGNGSPHHLAMELFKGHSGLKIKHIPYQGAAPAMVDLMSGTVDAMFLDLASGLPLMQSNKFKSLALASARRSPAMPNMPTFHELNLPEMDVFALQGLLGPAGMPDSVVRQLNTALNKTLFDHSVNQRMTDFGFEPLALSPEEFKQLARSESARWGKIIRQYKIRVD